MKKNKLGIYMGSFNPFHNGHLSVVNYLLDNNYVDKIIIVPTLNYWNKQDLIDIKDRINMIKFFENDRIIVDTKNNKCIYTINLVEQLIHDYPNSELYIIIGADNIVNLNKWKDYQKLLKYHIIIMNRDNINIYKYIKKMHGNFVIITNYPCVHISSTDIRNNLNCDFLDSRVLDYIKKNNLYK